MAHLAPDIAASIGEGPDNIDPRLICSWIMTSENPRALVAALPAALVDANPRVVSVLQDVLKDCNFGWIDLQKDIDNLAHNIEPGDTQHAKRARRA